MHVIGAAGLLPRELYEYRIELASVLDLTSSTARNVMGVTEAQLVAPDWRICQAIGEKAHTAGFQAILAPSATGVDEVLAVFPEKVGNRGRLEARMEELWVSTADLHRPR
jgi:RES domain-containing protein